MAEQVIPRVSLSKKKHQKNNEKLSESTLSEHWKIFKGYSIQLNAESRKKQFRNDRKYFGHFYCPKTFLLFKRGGTPTSLAQDGLEDNSPMSKCGTLALGYGRGKVDIILKELWLSVLTHLRLPEGMTQGVNLM